MASKISRDSLRKAIETCERYQKGMNLSDVRVTNIRIGKGTVAADITVVDDDGYSQKLSHRYDLISL